MKRYEHWASTQPIIEPDHGAYADAHQPQQPADANQWEWRLVAVIPSPTLQNGAVFYWERELREDE